MTTRVRRINFTPSAAVRQILEEVSALSGEPVSAVVSGMLEEVAPVMKGQLQALRQIAAAPEKAREHFQDYANRAIHDISQAAIDFPADARTVEGKRAKRRAARAATSR